MLGEHDASTDHPLAPTDFTEISLRRGPLGLVEAARALWPAPNVNLLVLVDQFEETIRATLQDSRSQTDEAIAFVKLLLEAVQQTELPIHVVLTMRSDYLGLCSRFRGLPEAINEGQYLVPRLTRDQLRSAIVGPAAVAGATVTTPLVQKLLEEIGDDQDRLPVLQHALMRTWALRSQADTLDLTDYSKTGGLANALSNHANEIYNRLDGRDRDIARLLFQRLTEGGEPGQETRRWARISEICDVAQASHDRVAAVVEAFRSPGCSFLMPPPGVPLTPDTTLDISHESLIRQWDELKKWTDEERNSAEEYQRLSAAAELHAKGQLSPWRSPELDIGLTWKKSNTPRGVGTAVRRRLRACDRVSRQKSSRTTASAVCSCYRRCRAGSRCGRAHSASSQRGSPQAPRRSLRRRRPSCRSAYESAPARRVGIGPQLQGACGTLPTALRHCGHDTNTSRRPAEQRQ